MGILTDAPSGSAKGERDTELGEAVRRAQRMLGRRYSLRRRGADMRWYLAVFADDEWHRPPVDREEITLGIGDSIAEMFERAEKALRNGRAAGINLAEPIPPKHDGNGGPCLYGCHR